MLHSDFSNLGFEEKHETLETPIGGLAAGRGHLQCLAQAIGRQREEHVVALRAKHLSAWDPSGAQGWGTRHKPYCHHVLDPWSLLRSSLGAFWDDSIVEQALRACNSGINLNTWSRWLRATGTLSGDGDDNHDHDHDRDRDHDV